MLYSRLPFIMALILGATMELTFAEEKPSSWSISVSTSGGWAGTGFGSVRLDSDRKILVTMEGDDRSAELTDNEFAALQKAVKSAKPADWEPKYEGVILDGYSYDLTLQRAGTSADPVGTVTWEDGALALPSDLRELISAIQRPWSRVRRGGEASTEEIRDFNATFRAIAKPDQSLTLKNGTIGILNGSIGILAGESLVAVPADTENGGIIILRLSQDGQVLDRALFDANRESVMEVFRVDSGIADGILNVMAHGKVPTTGWSQAAISPVVDVTPVMPPDGFYDFKLTAVKPAGIVHFTVTGISTDKTKIEMPPTMKGIRIRAATNDYFLRILQRRKELPSPVNELTLHSASVKGGTLDIKVEYGGGCPTKRREFEAVWTGTYLKSNPPVAVVRIIHKAPGDDRDTLLRETLHVALPQLDPCIVRVENGQGGSVDVRHNLP